MYKKDILLVKTGNDDDNMVVIMTLFKMTLQEFGNDAFVIHGVPADMKKGQDVPKI